MGASHARTLTDWVPGVQVSRIYDFDLRRAGEVSAGVGAATTDSAEALIEADVVDAVVIASPDRFHAEQVLACIRASKPVLCEKPLAADPAGSLRILEAEDAATADTGNALVQVGFMRRFDPAYLALRAHVSGGGIGTPRVVHCVHRNASSQTSTTSAGIVTGSMVHELDIVPWLLDDPVRAITVYGASGHEPVQDPQVAVLELASGAVATVEVFVNARYGYDVQCEVVGDEGTVALTPPYGLSVRTTGVATGAAAAGSTGMAGIQVADDFVARFADAYRLELAAWATAAARGSVAGPGTAEGHRANVVAAAGVQSLRTRARVEVPGD
jgi:myo-inositol 2-dehydrogenase/D-chiro-inositol 1-dehydrogenase